MKGSKIKGKSRQQFLIADEKFGPLHELPIKSNRKIYSHYLKYTSGEQKMRRKTFLI